MQQQAFVAADPVEVFETRCEARAHLFAECELTLHEAVDVLQAAAVNSGLVRLIGQNAVQQIISDAFALVRVQKERVGQAAAEIINAIAYNDEYEGLTGSFARACRLADEQQRMWISALQPGQARHHVPASTLVAAEYLIKLNDANRLEAWLKEHSEGERAAIVAYIDNKMSKP